jgi:DNA-binding NarL/FixJ family response regulator
MAYSILLVDDSPHIRRILRSYFEDDPEWQVCGEAENGEVALQLVKELKPDIVLLDFQMPVMNGLEAARKIRLLAPGITMLMFTMHYSEQLVREAHAAGIKEVLCKSADIANHLLLTLRNVCPMRSQG